MGAAAFSTPTGGVVAPEGQLHIRLLPDVETYTSFTAQSEIGSKVTLLSGETWSSAFQIGIADQPITQELGVGAELPITWQPTPALMLDGQVGAIFPDNQHLLSKTGLAAQLKLVGHLIAAAGILAAYNPAAATLYTTPTLGIAWAPYSTWRLICNVTYDLPGDGWGGQLGWGWRG